MTRACCMTSPGPWESFWRHAAVWRLPDTPPAGVTEAGPPGRAHQGAPGFQAPGSGARRTVTPDPEGAPACAPRLAPLEILYGRRSIAPARRAAAVHHRSTDAAAGERL